MPAQCVLLDRMMAEPSPKSERIRGRRRRDVLAELLPSIQGEHIGRDAAYVRELVETSLKVLRDGTGTGDLKLLNAALRELRYAFKVFAPYRGVRKVSCFGSARTPSTAPAYKTAKEFSRLVADRGYMVITGGGDGIMKACQEGAGRERSFGANIRLPFEQEANEFIQNDPKLVTFRYFFTRKLIFVKEADAVVLFPGGFGTHDEGYEVLTLVQTGKGRPLPIVFLDSPRGSYWKTWERYVHDHLLRAKLISPDDLALFKVTTSIEEAVEEITGFYRVYHSSRLVGHEFVIRTTRPVPASLVQELTRDFADILAGSKIVQSAALPDEREQEPELDSLPRLVCRLVHGRAGRLRQLIDRLNREG
jgi:uncharacterized protein (TIGR00730 family)